MLLGMYEKDFGFWYKFEMAKELVKEDNQKVKQISDLKIKAIEEISKREAEVRALKVKIHELMELSDTNEEEIKKLYNKMLDLEVEIRKTKFSYILQLRKILGSEKFRELHRRHRKPHR